MTVRNSNGGRCKAAMWGMACAVSMAYAPNAQATDYYVDAVGGHDTNLGTSSTEAWQTLAKLNTYLASNAAAGSRIEPGDTVYFKRGSVWDETLLIRRSGMSRSIISFRPYGDSGDAPTIRGSAAVGAGQIGTASGWTQDGNRWKTSAGVPADVRQVTFTKTGTTTVLPFARHPNVDINDRSAPDTLRTQSAVTCKSAQITSESAQDAPDKIDAKTCGLIHNAEADGAMVMGDLLHGADVIFRDGHFRYDRRRISSYDTVARKLMWVPNNVHDNTPIAERPATYPFDNGVTGGTGIGYGFFLAGKAWMIDQPGEWAVETPEGSAASTLYVRTPDGQPPAGNAIRIAGATNRDGFKGIDAQGSQFISIQDLQVVDAMTALELSDTQDVAVSGVKVARSLLFGVRANAAVNLTLDGNVIDQTAYQAIASEGPENLNISNNVITAVGTHLPPNGDTITAGNFINGISYFGIWVLSPNGATISGNVVKDNAGNGLFIGPTAVVGSSSMVSGNFVQDTCRYMDDCGAIYTAGATNHVPVPDSGVTFSGNFVSGVKGTAIGRPYDRYGRPIGGAAQGIYLDEYAIGVLVDGNVVVDADGGMQLHRARHNTVQNNTIVASRFADIRFDETQSDNAPEFCPDPGNCMVSNTVTGNFYVGLSGKLSYLLNSEVGTTSDFASFDTNLYANPFTGFSALDIVPGQANATYTWDQWWPTRDANSTLGLQRMAFLPWYGSPGSGMITNGDFSTGKAGWTTWSLAGDESAEVVGGNGGVNGGYVRFHASAGVTNDSIFNTLGGFALQAGKKYELRFAARSAGGDALAHARLRSNAGQVQVSQAFWFTATDTWQYFHAPMLASVADSMGRLDFQVPPGAVLDFDDVSLVEAGPLPNLVTNGDFASNAASWTGWAPSTDEQPLAYDSTGQFVTYVAPLSGDQNYIYSQQPFSVQANKRYLVRFAMRSPGQDKSVSVHLSGLPGSLSQPVALTVSSTWQNYTLTTTTTATADGTPSTRVNFKVPPGSTIDLDDVLVTEVTETPVPARSLIHVFRGGPQGQSSYGCPEAGTFVDSLCWTYVNLNSGQSITWPLSISQPSAAGSIVALKKDPQYVDTDGDGVADVDDLCPATPANTKVDERGCSWLQRRTP